MSQHRTVEEDTGTPVNSDNTPSDSDVLSKTPSDNTQSDSDALIDASDKDVHNDASLREESNDRLTDVPIDASLGEEPVAVSAPTNTSTKTSSILEAGPKKRPSPQEPDQLPGPDLPSKRIRRQVSFYDPSAGSYSSGRAVSQTRELPAGSQSSGRAATQSRASKNRQLNNITTKAAALSAGLSKGRTHHPESTLVEGNVMKSASCQTRRHVKRDDSSATVMPDVTGALNALFLGCHSTEEGFTGDKQSTVGSQGRLCNGHVKLAEVYKYSEDFGSS